MPRRATRGLEYTFLDKNFFYDRKVKRLKRKCGDDAPYAFLALLCLIVPEGYYIKYDNDIVYDIADMTGFDEDKVAKILDACGEVGLLDEHLMKMEQILTSHGIQKYYSDTCASLKRKSKVEEYSLLNNSVEDISSEEIAENEQKSTLIPNKQEEMHTKEKKRKEENNKEENYYSYSSIEKEQEEFISYMFFQDWASPNLEYQKFIAFNNTGGRSWEKMSHHQRQAALTLWKQQPEQKPHLGKVFLPFWQEVYQRLCSLDAPHDVRMDALSDGISWGERSGRLQIFCSDRLRVFLERHMDAFKPLIRSFQQRRSLSNDFDYRIIHGQDNRNNSGTGQGG